MASLGDPHAARLGHLEPVTDLEPAHRAPFDPLDRHTEVVQAHLGHGASIESGLAPSVTRTRLGGRQEAR